MHSSKQLYICPSIINFDKCTSTGKEAITRPKNVKSPFEVILTPWQVVNKPPH